MALIVEDGTGKADAESYASVAEADTYFTNRAVASWATLATNVKEASLRKATDYMLQVYRLRWNGTRSNAVQALDWPRAFVKREDYEYQGLNGSTFIGGFFYYPADEVPKEVKNACIELALKSSTQELNPDLTQGVVREKVDVIETEYDKYSPQSPRFKAIDNMLQPFFTGSANSHRVVRS